MGEYDVAGLFFTNALLLSLRRWQGVCASRSLQTISRNDATKTERRNANNGIGTQSREDAWGAVSPVLNLYGGPL